MRTVQIDLVEIDPEQQLLVRPRLSPGEDFAFIYRTATGVRWDSIARALTPVPGSAPAHQDWFKRIVEAVRGEYGCALVAAPETHMD
jgi:Integron Cassette Protein Hfx_Cass5